MKKLFVILFLTAATAVVSCSDVQRNPSRVYMPDMAYSRAYETYAERDSFFTTNENERGVGEKIFYNNKPVAGTIARGEELMFPLAKDKAGDTTNYVASKAIKNPYDSLSEKSLAEAERLYLINCGICHGKNLDGNGPLFNGGSGPYPAAPANFVANNLYVNMPGGQMFYSVTYGKNMMGSYASQLNRKQRWEIVYYIKQKQKAAKAASAPEAPAPATAAK
jgi:mono/diheme cytochrome c family protein